MSTTVSSLREATLDKIGRFLLNTHFIAIEGKATSRGILDLINLISDYFEEGIPLFPEILLIDNIEFLKTIPSRELTIYDGKFEISEFKQSLKLCAPLALNGWLIFIAINKDQMQYGLVSSEMSETSLSMYKQAIEMSDDETYKAAYIRNIGRKTVELVSNKDKCIISLTLDEPDEILNNQVLDLASIITSDNKPNVKEQALTYIEKLINEALKVGHGNLIVVVKNTGDYSEVKKILSGGVFLQKPINFEHLLIKAEEERSNTTSVELKAFSSLTTSMLNHDGITIFTSDAQILGYHFIIDNNNVPKGKKIVGGSRSRAFEAIKDSNLFLACFMKSQDGNIKFFKS